jgi:hypothetical protein
MATTTPTQNHPQHLAVQTTQTPAITKFAEPQQHILTNMFGVLNRFIARLDAGPEEQNQSSQAGFGFQVLRNTNPEVPLDPWFDFVIGINGRTIVWLTVFELSLTGWLTHAG